MQRLLYAQLFSDYCRIGSLEMGQTTGGIRALDYCRIGSLERFASVMTLYDVDYCRIGSLETKEPI